jgi:hypothetical protein
MDSKLQNKLIRALDKCGLTWAMSGHLITVGDKLGKYRVDDAWWYYDPKSRDERIALSETVLREWPVDLVALLIKREMLHKAFYRNLPNAKNKKMANFALDACIYKILFLSNPRMMVTKFAKRMFDNLDRAERLGPSSVHNCSLTSNERNRLNKALRELFDNMYWSSQLNATPCEIIGKKGLKRYLNDRVPDPMAVYSTICNSFPADIKEEAAESYTFLDGEEPDDIEYDPHPSPDMPTVTTITPGGEDDEGDESDDSEPSEGQGQGNSEPDEDEDLVSDDPSGGESEESEEEKQDESGQGDSDELDNDFPGDEEEEDDLTSSGGEADEQEDDEDELDDLESNASGADEEEDEEEDCDGDEGEEFPDDEEDLEEDEDGKEEGSDVPAIDEEEEDGIDHQDICPRGGHENRRAADKQSLKEEETIINRIQDKTVKRGLSWSAKRDISQIFSKYVYEPLSCGGEGLAEFVNTWHTLRHVESVEQTLSKEIASLIHIDPYPNNLSRMGIEMVALGVSGPEALPLYWNESGLNSKKKVSCYFDTSPSMRDIVPYMVHVADFLDGLPECEFAGGEFEGRYCFSGRVEGMTEEEWQTFRSGEMVKGGYSTSFESVIQHALKCIEEDEVDIIVVFTDGESGLSEEIVERFNATTKKCYVVYFYDPKQRWYYDNNKPWDTGTITSDLDKLTGESFTIILPEKKEQRRQRRY